MVCDQQSVEDRIRDVASPLARAIHLELIEVVCRGRGPGSVVRVTIDKPGGVNITDCEKLHHSLSRALDVLDPIPYAYRLEVSSPGLDRPLKHKADFQRSIGKLVRVTLTKPMSGEWVLCGQLVDTNEEGITLSVSSRTPEYPLSVAWGLIGKAKLDVKL